MTSTFMISYRLVKPLVAVASRNITAGCVELFTVIVVHSELALFNSNTLLMLWWLLKGCMGRRFCDAVVWIAELVRVKKVGN